MKGPCVVAAPLARRVVRVEHATVTNADAPLPTCIQSEKYRAIQPTITLMDLATDHIW